MPAALQYLATDEPGRRNLRRVEANGRGPGIDETVAVEVVHSRRPEVTRAGKQGLFHLVGRRLGAKAPDERCDAGDMRCGHRRPLIDSVIVLLIRYGEASARMGEEGLAVGERDGDGQRPQEGGVGRISLEGEGQRAVVLVVDD